MIVKRFDGRLDQLGTGGFATVYKASLSGKLVALKLLNVDPDPQANRRKAEAELATLKQLDHANVVQVGHRDSCGMPVFLSVHAASAGLHSSDDGA